MPNQPTQRRYVTPESIRRIFYIYQRNYQDLANIFAEMQKPEVFLPMWSMGNPLAIPALLDEVVRLLHNFVASAEMWVDHTRRLMRQAYNGTKIGQEYDREIQARFRNDLPTGFVKDLRNYTLHSELPAPLANLYIVADQKSENGEPASDGPTPVSMTHSFILSRDTLLAAFDWTGRSRAYLLAAPKNIDIGQAVDLHHAQLQAFYLWLDERLREDARQRLGG